MKKFFFFSAALFISAPYIAFAAVSVTGTNLETIFMTLGPIIQSITRILDVFALLGFFWGLGMFIWSAGDEKKRGQGRNVMIWGIIALFVLISITGLLNILQTTFSLNGSQTISPPSADPSQYNIGQ